MSPPIVDNKTVKWLLEEGFIPDAIINYIIVESYISPPNEIFYLKEMPYLGLIIEISL